MRTFKNTSAVRPTMVKLTTATEASLVYLHVSSFPPPTKDKVPAVSTQEKDKDTKEHQKEKDLRQPQPLSYTSALVQDKDPASPAPATPSTPILLPEVISPGGSGLSRSRSAFQPPTRTAASLAPLPKTPRSALPHQQSFNIPALPSPMNMSMGMGMSMTPTIGTPTSASMGTPPRSASLARGYVGGGF
jgi:hypothetical protein